MYPGVAEYIDPKTSKPYRVYISETTVRNMNPSFAGCPVYVQHVDDVSEDRSVLRGEAEGWVVESFYNQADGKHWSKFVTATDEADAAIKRGMRLSNCYHVSQYGPGGLWNGVAYEKEVQKGEYEHLAIVADPRYEESIILTPEEFKSYNEQKAQEIIKLTNGKRKKMGFKFFKKEKLKNEVDIEQLSVVLPKSGKEFTITKLVNDMDDVEVARADGTLGMEAVVTVGTEQMTVKDLAAKYLALVSELESLKDSNAEDDDEEYEDDDTFENAEDDEDDDEHKKKNEEDDAKMKAKEKKEKALSDAKKKDKKVSNSKTKKPDIEVVKKAERLRNAHLKALDDEINNPSAEIGQDQVERGKARYGS